MQILEIKVLKGPNYWSVRRTKLIQMKLDLEEKENMPTNKITGFRKDLKNYFLLYMNIVAVLANPVDFLNG